MFVIRASCLFNFMSVLNISLMHPSISLGPAPQGKQQKQSNCIDILVALVVVVVLLLLLLLVVIVCLVIVKTCLLHHCWIQIIFPS